MDTSLYVSLSSQLALERRLNTIANNVANANTTGFRAGQIKFEEVLDGVSPTAPSFVSEGQSYLSEQSGSVTETGASLDFAIQGDAWFAAETPAGTIVSRDGRFKMLDTGELVTLEGHAVLDSGGAPVQLNPAGGKPVVAKDGVIRQVDLDHKSSKLTALDQKKTRLLNGLGWSLLRVTNEEGRTDLTGVLAKVRDAVRRRKSSTT